MNVAWVALLVLLSALSEARSLDRRSPFHYEYKDKLYYIETYYKANFYKAFMSCSKLGMNLLSIDSEDEYDKVHGFIKGRAKYEVGLMFWTSGAATAPQEFHWMNSGNPVGLRSKWKPGEPNNNQGKENCLHMWLHEEKKLELNDTYCTMEMYYICESKKQ